MEVLPCGAASTNASSASYISMPPGTFTVGDPSKPSVLVGARTILLGVQVDDDIPPNSAPETLPLPRNVTVCAPERVAALL